MFLSECGSPPSHSPPRGCRPGEGQSSPTGSRRGVSSGRVGRAASELLGLPRHPRAQLAQGTSTYVYAGGRVIQGLGDRLSVTSSLLVPFLLALVDLLVRLRRARPRRLPGRQELRETARVLALDRGRVLPPRTGRGLAVRRRRRREPGRGGSRPLAAPRPRGARPGRPGELGHRARATRASGPGQRRGRDHRVGRRARSGRPDQLRADCHKYLRADLRPTLRACVALADRSSADGARS